MRLWHANRAGRPAQACAPLQSSVDITECLLHLAPRYRCHNLRTRSTPEPNWPAAEAEEGSRAAADAWTPVARHVMKSLGSSRGSQEWVQRSSVAAMRRALAGAERHLLRGRDKDDGDGGDHRGPTPEYSMPVPLTRCSDETCATASEHRHRPAAAIWERPAGSHGTIDARKRTARSEALPVRGARGAAGWA